MRSECFLWCLSRSDHSLMRPGRSPGAWSGSKLSSWFVDAVNSFGRSRVREQPPSLYMEREDDQGLSRLLSYAPASPFRKEEGGKRHVALGGAPNMVFPVSC
jgi:hypothetical protein